MNEFCTTRIHSLVMININKNVVLSCDCVKCGNIVGQHSVMMDGGQLMLKFKIH